MTNIFIQNAHVILRHIRGTWGASCPAAQDCLEAFKVLGLNTNMRGIACTISSRSTIARKHGAQVHKVAGPTTTSMKIARRVTKVKPSDAVHLKLSPPLALSSFLLLKSVGKISDASPSPTPPVSQGPSILLCAKPPATMLWWCWPVATSDVFTQNFIKWQSTLVNSRLDIVAALTLTLLFAPCILASVTRTMSPGLKELKVKPFASNFDFFATRFWQKRHALVPASPLRLQPVFCARYKNLVSSRPWWCFLICPSASSLNVWHCVGHCRECFWAMMRLPVTPACTCATDDVTANKHIQLSSLRSTLLPHTLQMLHTPVEAFLPLHWKVYCHTLPLSSQ